MITPAKILTEITITSLSEFTQQIENLTSSDAPFWFRGAGRADYSLTPSLYRHPTLTNSSQLIERESEILERFKQRSFPYLNRASLGMASGDYWDYFFIMQHFGVPTRLLDWSENPFISLYFALNSTKKNAATGVFDSDAAVWALNPNAWNKASLHDISGKGTVIAPGDPVLDAYNPSKSKYTLRKSPVAINGNHNSNRIVAQKGTFILFGNENKTMEDVFMEDPEYPAECLIKLLIASSAIDQISKSLVRVGITDSVVYPDLEGLAKEIKRQHEFLV
ncbi:FRG domain-containing protein [Dyadobacter alkalitolerans]|uniref:FRG domain-containing protein n=1 Tax=Dyadobacter alkalitolerans TaxID=492736 RepID=UPI0003F9FA7E|nr:FRG domain-containing protein [Dyadobacter alkalitolerans]